MSKHSQLGPKQLLFPLALAVFTLLVYIGNDLVLPAMLHVTKEFGVSSDWAPTSMSAYILGGAFMATIWGPLSDQLGRRKIFLVGSVFFIVCCLLILVTQSIEQFMLLRVLQGTALTLISAVGFATVQEAYEENQAVKVMALMANISLLAPLLGPVIGAVMIEHMSWHWGFVAIALGSLVAVFGLYRHMPETVDVKNIQPTTLGEIAQRFLRVYSNKRFMTLAIAGPVIGLPVMLWIALSPVFLMEELQLSSYQYALSQIPVLGALILGNLVLARWVDRFPLGKTIFIGFPFMVVGVLFMLLGLIFDQYLLWGLILGMSSIGFGEGLSYAIIYRFGLVASDVSKGTVAAAMATVMMVFFAITIELTKYLYLQWHFKGLWLMCALCMVFFMVFAYPVLRKIMQERELSPN